MTVAMSADAQKLAYALTEAVAVAAEPHPTLEDIAEWIGRRADEHYSAVQTATVFGGTPEGAAREIAVGRKAIDLMGKIVERKDEVLFLLRAPPRNQRGRR